ncbi:hypothetical protein PCASD_10671 [Puccinia coronata f. sp. avenae]|uniref:Uncharacterized protein n=1 Tax=Puccinia coronata f. sp. avenae TaxID=200324 RepID=A0A2N5UI86_9BASI|nr:hypothetical protein PCASD_10671 [Puccinia coronata f. sp. avenae]
MSLALSTDSNPPSSEDDLQVQSPRTAVNTNQRRAAVNASTDTTRHHVPQGDSPGSQVGPIRRTQGLHRPGPVRATRPATGLPGARRVASTRTQELGNTGNPARTPKLVGTENGASRQQLALGWPPAGVRMDHINEPVDEEFVSEVDTLFQLNGNYAGLGKLLAHVPGPRQYVVTLYSMLGVRQAIDLLRQELSTVSRPVATSEISGALAARNYHYVTIFGDFVRKEIRTLLMNKHLAVYGSEKPRNSPRRIKSLLTLVLDAINAKTPQFKHDYLPQGYQEGEPAAVASVESFVCDKLRNSRGKMRDMTTGGRESTHPVPNISALLSELRTRLIPLSPGEAPPPPPRGNETLLKSRLAYLRIQTITQYVGRGGRDAGRQWKNIDEHLCELAKKGRPYRSAFYQLVLTYDIQTFGHQLFSDMDGSSISLPSEEEILAQVAQNAENNAPAVDEMDGN